MIFDRLGRSGPRLEHGRSYGRPCPRKPAAEKLLQPAVVRLERASEPVADLGRHGLVLVHRPQRVGLGLPGGDAEEGRHGRHRSRRITKEVVARQDQQLLAREEAEPSLELLRVPPPGDSVRTTFVIWNRRGAR